LARATSETGDAERLPMSLQAITPAEGSQRASHEGEVGVEVLVEITRSVAAVVMELRDQRVADERRRRSRTWLLTTCSSKRKVLPNERMEQHEDPVSYGFSVLSPDSDSYGTSDLCTSCLSDYQLQSAYRKVRVIRLWLGLA
jgi:hypothetical protein